MFSFHTLNSLVHVWSGEKVFWLCIIC